MTFLATGSRGSWSKAVTCDNDRAYPHREPAVWSYQQDDDGHEQCGVGATLAKQQAAGWGGVYNTLRQPMDEIFSERAFLAA